jgi:hypothetical protein
MSSLVTLTRRQVKAADRVGGIELMLPWPAALPAPSGLSDDYERDASPAERAWAETHVQPEAQRHGLVLVRVAAARVRPPRLWRPDGGNARYLPALACIIIGRRWVHATGHPSPITMWAAPDA